MVEISLSGSGEGPGKATTRGYSTISRCRWFSPRKMTPWEVSRGRFVAEKVDSGRLSLPGRDRVSAQVEPHSTFTAVSLGANR